LDKYLRGKLTKSGLAAVLKLSIRQTDRILKRYKKGGLKGLIHKNRGRPSSHKMPEEKRLKIDELLKTRYAGFGPTFAAEKLKEEKGISVSPTQVDRMQKALGLWVPKRKGRKHRHWREPKKHRGEMAQFDGSEHKWFFWSDEYYTLLKFVDDATKEMLWAEFATNESYQSVMPVTMNYFKQHGKPVSIYVDCGKVFRVNLNNHDGERITQYQRALKECDVRLIHAYSPQAKGRIERSFGTDQDRLVKEMKLAKIRSITEANEFLKNYYIPKYNALFSRKAASKDNLHTSVKGLCLENIFCLKYQRKVQNDFTISYKNKRLQIYRDAKVRLYPKDSVWVFEHLNGTITIWGKGKMLRFKEIHVSKETHTNNHLYLTEEPLCRGEIITSIEGMLYGSTFVCNLGHFHWW
jgi:transposase